MVMRPDASSLGDGEEFAGPMRVAPARGGALTRGAPAPQKRKPKRIGMYSVGDCVWMRS
jgi:hypothetical protein